MKKCRKHDWIYISKEEPVFNTWTHRVCQNCRVKEFNGEN